MTLGSAPSTDVVRKLTRLESMLVDRQVATRDAIVAARERQRGAKRPLVEVLVEQGAVDEARLVAVLAEMAGVSVVEGEALRPQEHVQRLVPADLAQAGILPLRIEDEALVVATSDPFQVLAFDELSVRVGRKVRVVVARPSHLRDAMRRARHGEEALHELLKHAATDDVRVEIENARSDEPDVAADPGVDDGRIVRLVNLLIADAVRDRASDIHVEPEKERTRIRFRVDGELREISTVPAAVHASIVSRIKIVAGLDIIEVRRPQDGRAKVVCATKPYDLRVSTLPTYFGEKVVVRVLDPSAGTFDLDRCGMAAETVESWRGLLRRPHGMLLLTGPTGSGKTSTLFASLLELRDPSLNITTVEDPVEYQFPGIVHVPVRADIGMTFATALRSILRQDPDVVLVGEIRDKETAQVAVQAAMTGHLVLSTLHTNDAVSAVARLVDLGVEPSLIAASVLGVMAQRLARTICAACARPAVHGVKDLEPLGWTGGPVSTATGRGAGCSACGGSGYRGRTALTELVVMTPELSRLVASGAQATDIRRQARADGTRELVESGLAQVIAGKTTPAEVLAVAAGDATQQIAPRAARPQIAARAAAETPAGPCALVCDDDPGTRRLVELSLRADFPRIEQAQSGREALDKAASLKPDLLVVDHHMPGVSGLDVIRELRSHIGTLALPIVMLTASDDEDVEVASLDAGADDYLRKPVSAQRLRARVAALLASRRRSGESPAAPR
jgi:type IV pilus assembly protein PilB